MNRRIAITGFGAVTPLGVGAGTLLDGWISGECAIRDGFARCTDFDPADHLTIKERRRSDRFTQFALVSADEAFAQAGWDEGLPTDPTRIGCVIGTAFGGMETFEAQSRVLLGDGERRVSPLGITLGIPNAPPGMLALKHGLQGGAHSVVSACASGSDAIGTAARLIASGDLDAAVAGGADACLTPLAIAFTRQSGSMSVSGICRPFDARRDGLVLGEGAGVLVLEDAEMAASRGAPVLGEILGYGSTADAYHLTAPHPDGDGARRAIELALADAGVSAEDVDYVNAHGTSTEFNDRAETMALKAALGTASERLPVSSAKSVIGHLCGAAGAVEAVVTVGALRRGIVPPTVGYEVAEEGLDLDYVPNTARPLTSHNGAGNGAVAISNSFGFGGHNAVLCLGVPREP